MTSKELTIMAIERKNPPSYPILNFNRNVEKGDVIISCYDVPISFHSDIPGMTEWGFAWESVDGTIGQPKLHPLENDDTIRGYQFPDPNAHGRMKTTENVVKKYSDKFIIGTLGITGFNLVTFLRGFENALVDIYTDPEAILEITDKVMDFENGLIRKFAEVKVDAIAFSDDWGTQRSLIISPDVWRKYFKPRYKKQFELAHELGRYVYFHCCGYILDIIPDLIEIGVDIINLNQPDIFGIEDLANRFAGTVCFNCPVDHQTTAIKGTEKEIEDYILRLKNNLSKNGGGFIGYIEDYSSLGMSEETYNIIEENFYKHNKY